MAQANEKPARRKNRYYWIRLKENFFEDDRIRIIASVPDGDSILIFYLKLMLKSIQGEGELFKDRGIDCTPQILGAVTGTDPNIVQRALELLQSLNMIETEQERLFIPKPCSCWAARTKAPSGYGAAAARQNKNLFPHKTPHLRYNVTRM